MTAAEARELSAQHASAQQLGPLLAHVYGLVAAGATAGAIGISIAMAEWPVPRPGPPLRAALATALRRQGYTLTVTEDSALTIMWSLPSNAPAN